MPQNLFLIHQNGKDVGQSGYSTLEGACRALQNFPDGTEVVQVDAEGRVVKSFSRQECEDALRSPIIRSK